MLGNRGGRFHRDDKTLGRRRWASQHWICCELHYKGKHHEAMGKGYTSLFFLDEVTALAAGHRPCFYCRRSEATAFLAGERASVFDDRLHGERRAEPLVLPVAGLPDGAMLERDGAFFAKRGQHLLRWSFEGYTAAATFNATMREKVLTAPSIIAILARGFQPRWHPSALQWD